MAKAVKMKDIADRLHVSTMTVSKALSGKPGVSEVMRERIRILAFEMGYVLPGTQKEEKLCHTIGVILESCYIEGCETFYWKLYQEINIEAARRNCFVLLEILEEEEKKELRIPKMISENKVDGLLVLGETDGVYLEMLLLSAKVPIVYLDFYNDQVREDSVISNGFYGTYHMTNYLFERGHRQIAFVGTLSGTKSIMDRFLGYEKSMLEHGESIRQDWVIPDRDGERAVYEIIILPEKMPTAFVCSCDLTASRLIRELKRNGYRIPEDISVVGYDDYLYPGLCDVGLTSYAVDKKGMACAGIDILLSKIQGKAYARGMRIVDGYLAERESVASLESDLI